jgi:membrane-associated phospholipid phosphatase
LLLRTARRARLVLFAGGAALFVGSGILAAQGLSDTETRVFRALNQRTDALRRPNWVLMLGGTFGAIPVSAGAALLAKRPHLATRLAAGGTAAYILAKVVKPAVGRGRPGNLLADVAFRDEISGDQGWISGHTAVSSSLVLIAGPSLPPALRAGAFAWAGAVATGRMYAGAHLPLDVVGGAGLGMMIAALTRPRP